MSTVAESAASQGTPVKATLAAGLEQVSANQVVTFRKYVRLVLPLDGFIFWVNADLVSTSVLDGLPDDAGAGPNMMEVDGSLHYATDQDQLEDESAGVNRVLFACQRELVEFNAIGRDTIFIGEIDDIRFSFNRHGMLQANADTFHYEGIAILPAMESQVIDDLEGFDSHLVVVSNSLPLWLSLNKIMPVYPSFAVPENIHPPYATAHIFPDSTNAIQAAPAFDKFGSHWQLVTEQVRIIIYGLRSNDALDWQDYAFQYSLDTDNFGVMNMPVIRDEKRTQTELTILAMKKSIVFNVSYYQVRIQELARRLIVECIPTYIINPL